MSSRDYTRWKYARRERRKREEKSSQCRPGRRPRCVALASLRETPFLRRAHTEEPFENGAGNKGRGRCARRRLVIQRVPGVVSSIGYRTRVVYANTAGVVQLVRPSFRPTGERETGCWEDRTPSPCRSPVSLFAVRDCVACKPHSHPTGKCVISLDRELRSSWLAYGQTFLYNAISSLQRTLFTDARNRRCSSFEVKT